MPSPSAHSTNSAQAAIEVPFSQSWIQALTVVAANPLARTIKPKLELVNSLTLARSDVDRLAVSQQLWDLAVHEKLTDLLGVLPIAQAQWVFDSDDNFLYQRVTESGQVSLAQREGEWNCAAWQQALGLIPLQVNLSAEVFGGDWASLVRKEAVRLQQSFNMAAVGQANTVRLPCTAKWNVGQWSVRFDQVEWVVIPYDEIPYMPRPAYADLAELLNRLISVADSGLLNKQVGKSDYHPAVQPWAECVESLAELQLSLSKSSSSFSPWMARVWHCVWPIVYREQHVLRDRADLEHVRRELKVCLEAQPRLCQWMFLFAKLVCQTQLGNGLGFCADYRS